MKNLWAPWRMEYILSDKEKGCFLCDAANSDDDREALVVARGEKAFVLLNLYPYSNCHILITPYQHTSEIEALDTEELGEMTNLLVEFKLLLDRVVSPQGFNVGINLGRCAGAGLVSHIHMHLVPRWEGDNNFMPVIGETKIIPQHIDEMWEQLMEARRQC